MLYLTQGANENEFLIEDEDDLKVLAEKCLTLGTAGITFKQTDNLDLDGEAWDGIGTWGAKDNNANTTWLAANAFQGTYDGGNYLISGLALKRGDGSTTHEYGGLFNGIYNATVKNLKIQLGGNKGFYGESTGVKDGGAPFVGVAVASTLSNLVTVKGEVNEFKAEHAAGGIVGFVYPNCVIENCTNVLDITSVQNKKAAGIAACIQGVAGEDASLTGCYFAGKITASAAGEAGGLVACFDVSGSFTIADCTSIQNGSTYPSLIGEAVTWTDGRLCTVNVTGNNVVNKDIKPFAWTSSAAKWTYNGPAYADISGDNAVLTSTLAANGQYKVMDNKNDASTDTVALAKNDTVSFDETFFNFAGTVTTTAGYEVKPATEGKVTTYSVVAKTFNITYTYTGAEDTTGIVNGNPTEFTVETSDITIDLAKITLTGYTATAADPTSIACSEKTDDVTVTITLTADAPVIDPVTPGAPIDVPAGADPAKFLDTVNANKDQYLKAPGEAETTAAYRTYFTAKLVDNKVVFELNTAGEKALQDSANGEIVKVKPGDIAAGEPDADGNITVAVESPIQGFYYAVKQGSGIGTMAVVDEGVLADGKAISLKYHQYKGAGFYSIVVSPRPITPEN